MPPFHVYHFVSSYLSLFVSLWMNLSTSISYRHYPFLPSYYLLIFWEANKLLMKSLFGGVLGWTAMESASQSHYVLWKWLITKIKTVYIQSENSCERELHRLSTMPVLVKAYRAMRLFQQGVDASQANVVICWMEKQTIYFTLCIWLYMALCTSICYIVDYLRTLGIITPV